MLVLKKPFDNIEVMQRPAPCEEVRLTQIANRQLADLDALVAQRTAELNRSLANREIAQRTAARDLSVPRRDFQSLP